MNTLVKADEQPELAARTIRVAHKIAIAVTPLLTKESYDKITNVEAIVQHGVDALAKVANYAEARHPEDAAFECRQINSAAGVLRPHNTKNRAAGLATMALKQALYVACEYDNDDLEDDEYEQYGLMGADRHFLHMAAVFALMAGADLEDVIGPEYGIDHSNWKLFATLVVDAAENDFEPDALSVAAAKTLMIGAKA